MTRYVNGRIFTGDPERPWAGSLVVEDGRIADVGEDATGDEADTVDLGGALVLPGFIDAHTHLLGMGNSLSEVALVDAESLGEIQQRVRAAAAAVPEAHRIQGNGWLYSALGDVAPTREFLDEVVPDRPVYLAANDQHSAWVNTAALTELGIDDDTPDPIGGVIERDAAGHANGVLTEMAALGLMRDFLDTTTTAADDDAALATAFEAYLAAGVTGAVDMGLDDSALAALERAVDAEGRLPLRVTGHWLVSRTSGVEEDLAQVETAVAHARRLDGEWLRVTGIKIMADGVIDSCTAAMRAPYADGSHPGPIWDLESLIPVVRAADAAGLQIAVHAIGDHASEVVLTALEDAVRVNGSRPDRRHRIEHLETVTPESIQRLARLGVVASMQPVHSDPAIQDNWRAMLGDERVERGYPWPELIRAGATLAFGTDAPTAPYQPLANMFIAATRLSALDPELPPNLPGYALPLAEAIVHATRDAAFACRWERVTGRLAEGLSADFVVLDADPFAEGPEALLTAGVVRTVVGGRPRTPA